eukprot:scaffold220512_cov23-Tisochrysis_lutea.AAC.3
MNLFLLVGRRRSSCLRYCDECKSTWRAYVPTLLYAQQITGDRPTSHEIEIHLLLVLQRGVKVGAATGRANALGAGRLPLDAPRPRDGAVA